MIRWTFGPGSRTITLLLHLPAGNPLHTRSFRHAELRKI
jgi:hypothetical protein